MQTMIRVNTKTGGITAAPMAEKYRVYGKRGLVDRFLLDEVDPKCDPLGADNKLVICTGTFAGTSFPVSGRVSLGGKSPLTGTIKESSVGGMMGPMMAGHGIKMIVLEDLPVQDAGWKYLYIDKEGRCELIDASALMGLGTYDVCGKMFEKYSKDIAVMCIGPAGDMLYRSAAVMVSEMGTGHPCRAAGRGGLGALMGSKKIKAVVAEKAEKPAVYEYADKARFDEARKKFVQICRESPHTQGLHETGSTNMMDITGPLGIVPHRNFSGLPLSEEQKALFTSKNWKEAGTKAGGKNGLSCHPGCIVMCSNIYHDDKGNFITAGFEYETAAMFGPNLEIYDFYKTARFDYLCDDIGVDSIETGCTMGVCMEGGKIAWGDADGVEALFDELREGTEFGRLMGQGTEALGKAIGVTRIPVVKHQGIPAYDPRGFKGNGITYCVSTQGADHTFGMVVAPGAPDEVLPDMAINAHISTALANDFLCSFISGLALADPDMLPELYAGAFGGEWTMDKCMEMAKESLKTERMFNEGAGFTSADDRLPEFLKQAGYEGGPAFTFTDEEVQKHMNAIYPYK
ncbi:MAG: aldehyde ferredoxin oxidoreductase [Clostridiales bacterium]|nr:aldehyde ferredoxin oxidoreductase [Clostridiales bacterium]